MVDAQQMAVFILRPLVVLVKPRFIIMVTLGPSSPTRCLHVPEHATEPLQAWVSSSVAWGASRRGGGHVKEVATQKALHDCFVREDDGYCQRCQLAENRFGVGPPRTRAL